MRGAHMELNRLNSDDYIYLRLNEDIENDAYKEKKGNTIGFTRRYLESAIYSSIYYQGIDDILEITRKDEIKDTDILPTQVNESMVVKEDKVVDIRLFPNRSYVLNDWLISHLTNDSTIYDFNDGSIKITDFNMRHIEKECSKALPQNAKYPMITTGDDEVRLKITFKKGESLDFTNPGVMSLLYDPNEIALLASSEVILAEEKEECFKQDFQNAFFANNGHLCSSEELFRYYRINDDVNVSFLGDLGTYDPTVVEKDEDDNLRIVYLNLDSYDDKQFKREAIVALNKVATEIPLEEAKQIHEARLIREKEEYDEMMREFHEKEEKHERELEEAYKNNKDNSEIFPGAGGHFVQTYKDPYQEKKEPKRYTLAEIKEFFNKLKDINKNVLDYMYFYGGTIPYMLTNADTSRDFGDVDIFVPIEAMRSVREELQHQPSFEVDFDSINVTSRVNLTSHIPTEEKDDTTGLGILFALMNPNADDETLSELFNHNSNRCLQDFGLKGKLFGVNISIFPIYQYNNDLMAKSFNITDMYEYLLAVRVMNNTEVKDFAKNVQICGNNIKVLPIEYIIISKESAIEQGYQKRAEKDKEDLAYIQKHKEELAIDDEFKEQLKEKYPDYSIAMAYFVGPSGVEEISGEKYKDLMLLNQGKWLS